MILKTVQVKNFRCINDSTVFSVDDKVTCLVGKNESGKTAILQAISRLNSEDHGASDFDLLNYPRRHMMEYQQRAETEPADALSTTWELSPEDTAELESVIGPAAQQIHTIAIDKGYSNETIFTFEVDEAAVVEYVISSHQLDREELQPIEDAASLEELHQRLTELENRSDR